jgi:N-acetylmuramoyl-L-alanine amidase
MRLIRRGERSNAVQDLQARLERLGIDIGPQELGGDFGPTTEMAVRAFQQSRGLDVDGIVGDNTWRVLVESSWALGDRILRLEEPNLRGDDVRDLQSRLNALGFAAGKHDGIYGRGTAGALKDFQRNLGISDDGLVGLETLKAFRRLRLVTRTGQGPRTREREARRASPPGVAGKRLVLDPGHGGDDLGAWGPSGETEADLVFPLATQLAARLEADGAEVTLTRGPYDGPTDSERARRANEAGADLLISLHLNAHPNEMARGRRPTTGSTGASRPSPASTWRICCRITWSAAGWWTAAPTARRTRSCGRRGCRRWWWSPGSSPIPTRPRCCRLLARPNRSWWRWCGPSGPTSGCPAVRSTAPG